MATVVMNVGPQSPLNRNLERLLDEAQSSGELRISSRRLREFPKVASKYNLNDTVYGDLSKNKLSELPMEVTRFSALEKLNLYHNVIRFIPEAVVYLQCLTYLDLSRNQLSVLPAHLCRLPLRVLLVSHNRLVSLPEEINQLSELIELDASSNQLSHLPIQLGDLQHLEALNLRKNFLVEIPKELMFLKLVRLDMSLNRISVLPVELRFMVSLVELCVEHNPLTSPPAHLCTRGRIHIFKYLEIEAIKEDRKRGILEGGDCRAGGSTRLPRKPSTLPDARLAANDPRRKKFTTETNGNGFASAAPKHPSDVGTDGPDCSPRWAPPANGNGHPAPVNTSMERPQSVIQQPPPNNKMAMDDDYEEEEAKEERRRAARKIIEQQMGPQQEEHRLPGHVQTYREYKESIRQQRGNVYNNKFGGSGSNGSSHTPSPDTPPGPPPPMTDFVSQGGRSGPPVYKPNPLQPSPVQDFSRPLTLNLSQEDRPGSSSSNSSSVKAAQKEAVLSYVKAKTSPSAQPSPAVGQHMLSPTMNHRPFVDPAGHTPPSSSPSAYHPPPAAASSSIGSPGRKLPAVPSAQPSAQTRLLNRQNSQNGHHAATSTTPPHAQHTAATASFTVRREMERQREEMEQIQQLRQCIESRLKVSLPDDLPSALMDGVVLCHLVNHIRPRSVLSIHVPSPAVPKLTVAKCRRNVDNFIDACRRIGVPEDRLCSSADVLERRNTLRVSSAVAALVAFHRPHNNHHPHHPHHPPHYRLPSAGV